MGSLVFGLLLLMSYSTFVFAEGTTTAKIKGTTSSKPSNYAGTKSSSPLPERFSTTPSPPPNGKPIPDSSESSSDQSGDCDYYSENSPSLRMLVDDLKQGNCEALDTNCLNPVYEILASLSKNSDPNENLRTIMKYTTVQFCLSRVQIAKSIKESDYECLSRSMNDLVKCFTAKAENAEELKNCVSQSFGSCQNSLVPEVFAQWINNLLSAKSAASNFNISFNSIISIFLSSLIATHILQVTI